MNYTKLLILTAICASTTVHASSVTCPATVKAGKPLIVKAEFTNRDCEKPILIANSVLSLFGNSASTIGLQGPFVNPLASSIPAATCGSVPNVQGRPEYGSHIGVIDEGTLTLENLLVIKSVPAGMKGKLAIVSAAVLDIDNKLMMAGECIVTVK